MARIFLDANTFIDLVEQRRGNDLSAFQGGELFISPLSVHILSYIYKYELPNKKLLDFLEFFNLVPMSETLTRNALEGPTTDFEDNTQLHSCVLADCDFFLTSDRQLLRTKFFGKARIVSRLEEKKSS
jgi:hypothetical protein